MASQNKSQSTPTTKKPVSKAKRVARCGMLVALAFIFSYVEAILPISVGIPGVRLGLANLVVLSMLYLLTPMEVFAILLGRIVLAGLTFGTLFSMIYSLAGGVLSFLIMLFFCKRRVFSVVGVSILGGVTHNMGQLLVAMFVVENLKLAYYLPVLLISGATAGAVIGILGKRLQGIRYFQPET